MAGIRPVNYPLPVRRPGISANLAARAAWEGRRIWKHIGWSIGIGVVCIGAASLAWWDAGQLAAYEKLLAGQLESARSQSMDTQPGDKFTQDDLVQQLSAFYAFLPDHAAIPDQLKELFKVAQANNVVLVQAKYEVQPDASAGFVRYQIVLPVKASYPDIQHFIVQSLKQLPTLTLEVVTFKRERIEAVDVDAKIHYVLLVRKPAKKGDA